MNWLNLYLDLRNLDISKLSHKITMSICEIEKIYKVFEIHKNIVVGKIVECKKLSDTSHLSLCKVDVGNEILQIVCGASNVKNNIFVAVAKIGAELKIDNQILKIEKRTIKDTDSYGMICSAKELGIQSILGDHDGILVLDDLPKEVFEYAKAKSKQKEFFIAGKAIQELFPYEDTILEIDNKSITNRPDLWSHFGFALELSAILNKKIHYNPLKQIKKFKEDISLPKKEIIIQNGSALAYHGIVCTNLVVQDSPLWMRILLNSINQKCINNIVDISNFVMYELGQPNHAFDLRNLRSNTILCDLSKKEFLFKALDNVEYTVPVNSIVIYDNKTPVALGGIIGGENSSIKKDTTEIFIESATFPRSFIRKTISITGIRTESAKRFEKGLDPARSRIAIYRFLELLKKNQPNIKIGKLVSKFTVPEKKENKILTSVDFIQKKLGFPIKEQKIKEILTKLNFKVKIQKNKKIQVVVPSYRSYYDITIPEDIIEEIGRIYGYDNIQPIPPKVDIQKPTLPYKRYFERQWKMILSSSGKIYETMNYSFSSLEDNELFGISGIELLNPAQKHKNRMRTSLFPGLLEQTYTNIFRTEEFGLYELGRIFIPQNSKKLPQEPTKFNLVYVKEVSNQEHSKNYNDSQDLEIVYYVRKIIEKLLYFFNFSFKTEVLIDTYQFLHPKCQMEWYTNQKKVGFLGLLHPKLYKKYSFPEDKRIVLAELDYESLFNLWNERRSQKETHYKPPSQAPKSTFDFTILMPENEYTNKPVELIKNLYPEFIKIDLINIYQGSNIPEHQKSVTYRVHCLDKEPIPHEKLQKMLDEVVRILENNGFPLRV